MHRIIKFPFTPLALQNFLLLQNRSKELFLFVVEVVEVVDCCFAFVFEMKRSVVEL